MPITTRTTRGEHDSLYLQAMHELAALVGLEPSDILKTPSLEADGTRFYFQDLSTPDKAVVGVLAEIGEIPPDAEAQILRQLLEANSHFPTPSGTYALVPGTRRAALRTFVELEDQAEQGERILAVLNQHLATCTAVRHLGADLPVAEQLNVQFD